VSAVDRRPCRGDLRGEVPGIHAGAGEFLAPDALYIHVPVCASKCSYCDFFSLPASSQAEDFEDGLVDSTLRRASALADRFGAEGFSTVYVGGGTPTMLSAEALDRLLAGIRALAARCGGRSPVEWTVEANPDSLSREKLDVMVSRGVTRLSVGAQSLDPSELALLGRRHGAEEALLAVEMAAKTNMAVSADLIAGIPSLKSAADTTREPEKLARAARQLVGAGASHLSVYDLSVEEGSPLEALRSVLSFPDEDEIWEERGRLEETLAEVGMRRYEVSNYAACGDECLHNLVYWKMDSYIGAGPGAVSTIARKDGASLRIEEEEAIRGYGEGGIFKAAETLIGLRDAVFETVMMAFRTAFGLDLAAFARRFGLGAETIIGSTLESWRALIVPGEPWPRARGERGDESPARRSAGPALGGAGLDILNRFLGECLDEMDREFSP
jgi:oxygen-independent coproporphyrinogen III oxidase